MRKHVIWPFVAVFILMIAVTAALIGTERVRYMCEPAKSLDRRVMPDGAIVELIETNDNSASLRKILPSGEISRFLRLPEASGEDLFPVYRMIGLIGSEIFFYHYESPGNTPDRYNQAIMAYNMNTGWQRVVSLMPEACENEVLTAIDIYGEKIMIGYLNRESGEMDVYGIDIGGGNMSVYYSVKASFQISTIAVTYAGGLYALSCDSNIYNLKDGEWMNIFNAGQGEVIANMMEGADGLLYIFVYTDYGMRTAVSTYETGEFRWLDIDATNFIKLHLASAGNWVAMDKDYEYVVSSGGKRMAVGTVTVPLTLLWDKHTLYTLAALAFLQAGLLFAVRHVLIKRKLPLLLKLLAVILPVFTVGMGILVSAATESVVETTEKDICGFLLEYADETIRYIDGQRFARINWDEPYNDSYFLSMSEYMRELSQYRRLSTHNGETDEEYIAYTSFWLYRVDGEKVYTAICDYYVIGVEMAYFEPVVNNDARMRMLKTHAPVYDYLDGIDSETRWLGVLQPIIDNDEVVGYLEISRPLVAINAAIEDVRERIMLSGILVFSVIIAVLIIILTLSTHTLVRLKRGALAVSGGDYSVRVVSRSWDETGDIAAAFNKMSESVDSAVKDITAVSRGYSRFVSNKLIDMLGKGTIKALKPGDNVTMTATQILVFTDSFDAMGDRALFNSLGRFYHAVLPGISGCGGLISGNSAHGFNALFACAPEEVLRAMLNVFAALDRLEDKIDCHIFLNYSGVMLGVTGNKEHLNMITVSRLAYESYEVGVAGKRFGTRLIVEQNACDVMEGGRDTFRRRFIGYLCADGEMKGLYDFYDCDLPEIRNKKDEGKENFELGVRLYYAKDYKNSRRIFVDIIKAFPEDMAAREYLRRSNAGVESGGEPMPLIELD